MEGDSQNIIQQYEERLLRYQKMIEEADHTAETQRKSLANATRTHEELIKRIQALQLIAGKVFALPGKEKETSDAVEELCEIEKCKEFAESLEGLSAGTDTEALGKLVLLLTKNNQLNLNRRRDQRIAFLKRETQLGKTVEEERSRAKMLQSESNHPAMQYKPSGRSFLMCKDGSMQTRQTSEANRSHGHQQAEIAGGKDQ